MAELLRVHVAEVEPEPEVQTAPSPGAPELPYDGRVQQLGDLIVLDVTYAVLLLKVHVDDLQYLGVLRSREKERKRERIS